MKKFKILFSVLVIGLMALQPMHMSFAEANCEMGESKQIGEWMVTEKAKKKMFKAECKPDCELKCFLKKRDNPDITIFKF